MTPNPDVWCNRYLKFGKLFEDIQAHGCDTLVTGHYCQTRVRPDGQAELIRAADRAKDQSYFLSQVKQVGFGRSGEP